MAIAKITMAVIEMIKVKMDSSRCNVDGAGFTWLAAWLSRPIIVRSPIVTTMPNPLPSSTEVPEKQIFLLSK